MTNYYMQKLEPNDKNCITVRHGFREELLRWGLEYWAVTLYKFARIAYWWL